MRVCRSALKDCDEADDAFRPPFWCWRPGRARSAAATRSPRGCTASRCEFGQCPGPCRTKETPRAEVR